MIVQGRYDIRLSYHDAWNSTGPGRKQTRIIPDAAIRLPNPESSALSSRLPIAFEVSS